MNYININDAYNISKALTENENIYGLSSMTDSHLIKNSEWGACSYLSRSQYGLGTTDIMVNNITLNSGSAARTSDNGKTGVESVYAVTGVTSNSQKVIPKTEVETYGADIKNATGDTSVSSTWGWNQKSGTTASTTGTIYGIYDMSGGTWEETASYVPNKNGNLNNYGKSVAYDEKGNLKIESTKYTMSYKDYNAETDKPGISDTAGSSTKINLASTNNWIANTKIYGDGVRETSTQGTEASSWYSDYSYFPALYYPFFYRGGNWNDGSHAGVFAFHRANDYSYYYYGFRSVLVVF